jgi:hypothetical protein
MARKNPQRREVSLRYPGRLLKPEDLLSFIESKVFGKAWRRCNLTDDDLLELQLIIMAHPRSFPVVEGSGGLRKLRFSPTGSAHGKSGSHRACYVYYEEFGIVLLLTAYPKNKKDDLSADALKAIRRMIEEQHALLRRGPIK